MHFISCAITRWDVTILATKSVCLTQFFPCIKRFSFELLQSCSNTLHLESANISKTYLHYRLDDREQLTTCFDLHSVAQHRLHISNQTFLLEQISTPLFSHKKRAIAITISIKRKEPKATTLVSITFVVRSVHKHVLGFCRFCIWALWNGLVNLKCNDRHLKGTWQ